VVENDVKKREEIVNEYRAHLMGEDWWHARAAKRWQEEAQLPLPAQVEGQEQIAEILMVGVRHLRKLLDRTHPKFDSRVAQEVRASKGAKGRTRYTADAGRLAALAGVRRRWTGILRAMDAFARETRKTRGEVAKRQPRGTR